MKLLVVKLDQIGDFAVTLPALRAAYEAGHQVDVVVGPWNAGWKEVVPWIGKWWISNLVYSRRKPMSLAQKVAAARSAFSLAWRLSREKYDIAVDLRLDDGNQWQGKFITWLSRAPRRVGGFGKSAVLLTHSFAPTQTHQEDRLWERLNHAVPVPPAQEKSLVSVARSESALRRPTVMLHPGTLAATRSWLPDYWIKLAQQLPAILSKKCRLILAGGPGEKDQVMRMAASVSEAGIETLFPGSLREFLEVLAGCDLLVGVNSAPVHLARLVGTPTITIFSGEVRAEHWGARGDNLILQNPVSCAPCGSEVCRQPSILCMERITPEQVLEAIVKRLGTLRPDSLAGGSR
jgi:heptosyltransferase I